MIVIRVVKAVASAEEEAGNHKNRGKTQQNQLDIHRLLTPLLFKLGLA